jgi:steroid 5-alpha reductase family enzyme
MSAFPWGDFAAALPLTLLAAAAVLALTFLVALRVGRHAVVDVAWGLGYAVVAVTSLLVSAGSGDDGRRALVTTLTVVWGVRLGLHIASRSIGKGEDPRYAALMKQASGNPHLFALRRIYLTQAATIWFVSLPVQVAVFETSGLGLVAWIGVALWGVGFFFETAGDWQLARFRSDPDKQGQVLDTGLWRYTRHPNYFGDACVWWGLSLIAFDAWPGILTILSPIVMTWLLAKGTGKPLLEKDIGERRPGYVDYVRRTSGFIPRPPKNIDSPKKGTSP